MKIRAFIAFLAALVSFGVIIVFILSPLVLLRSFFKHPATGIMRLITLWGDRAFRIVCVILRIQSTFSLPALQAMPRCIIICNHQSTMDILVVLAALRGLNLLNTRWVGKREALRYPFIGYLVRKSGALLVDRDGNPDDRRRIHEGAARARHEGASPFLFPEGTRFAGKGPIPGSGFRHVLPPKPGGFYSLRDAVPDAPVLSLTLCWTSGIGERAEAKTIFQSAEYFGARVLVTARLVWAREIDADPDWLYHEWERKDAELDRPA